MRFVGVVSLNEVFFVNYTGQNPFDLIHKIAPRNKDNGELDKWIIV